MTEKEIKAKRETSKPKEVVRLIIKHESAVLGVVLIALIGGMGVATKGLSLARVNMVNVILQSSIRGLASIGQFFVILSAGIDLSVGGIGLACTILGSLMMTSNWQNIVGHPVSIFIVIPVMLLVGAAFGALNGFSVSRVGMPPLIVTLVMWEATKGIGFLISQGQSVSHLPEELTFFGQAYIAGVPVPVIIFVTAAVVAYFVLHHTTYGRSVYAVGGNPISSWLSGINVRRVLFSVYVIAGFLTGLAAVVFTGRVMSASMRSLVGLELDSIAAVVIGGVSLAGGSGTIIGVVIGVLIIGFINNGMSILGANPDVQYIARAVIIYIAVSVDYIRRQRRR